MIEFAYLSAKISDWKRLYLGNRNNIKLTMGTIYRLYHDTKNIEDNTHSDYHTITALLFKKRSLPLVRDDYG